MKSASLVELTLPPSFGSSGIRVRDVLDYLDWRQPQFDKGKTPELTKRLESLRAKLTAMRAHGFLPA